MRTFQFPCLLIAIALNANAGMIGHVRVNRTSFNASGGEAVTLAVAFLHPGTATVLVIDRDGYVVRTLASSAKVAGLSSFTWNGQDDAGTVVPDEAYSFKITWTQAAQSEVYFPASEPSKMITIQPRYYDRRTATLSYVLEKPSRVHVQAGTAIFLKNKDAEGPVMKTVVNREPRAAGAIAEHWNGFDQSGMIFIPDLPHFVVAIAAEPLPENAVITFGNRSRSFIAHARERTGTSLFSHQAGAHHHNGLSTIDDVSPVLNLRPVNAVWSAHEQAWLTADGDLRVRVTVNGPTATSFVAQPARLYEFIDGHLVGSLLPRDNAIITVPLAQGPTGQRLSVNWQSDWGPVAVNTLSVRRQLAEPGAAR